MTSNWIYILLGIIQGFTEPLPISSSGHVALVSALLGFQTTGIAYAAFINFGSTIAIIAYFWNDIKRLFWGGIDYLKSGLKTQTEESDYLWKVFWATIPMVIVTIIIEVLGITIGESIRAIGFALFITSMSLFFVSNKDGHGSIKQMPYVIAFLIGVGQALALMPGISRSGMTMVFALALGLNRKDAFDFSFMMFIPASIGGLLYSLYEITQANDFSIMYIVSAIFALIFTIFGLKLTRRFVMASKLHYFAIYCLFISFSVLFIFT